MILDESIMDDMQLEFELEQLAAAGATADLAIPGCSGCHKCAAVD
jgi:hypothetical protein